MYILEKRFFREYGSLTKLRAETVGLSEEHRQKSIYFENHST